MIDFQGGTTEFCLETYEPETKISPELYTICSGNHKETETS